MIKLDDDLLQELGLAGLPPEEKKKLLAHIYETLEMRVGMKLAERMSDAQLTEFEQFIDRNDEAGALHWLEQNFPNYKDVVATEFEVLKKEIGQVAPQILGATQQQPAPQSPIQPMNPMGPTPAPQQYGVPAPAQPVQPMWQGDQATGAPDPWGMPPQPGQSMSGGAPAPAPMPQQPFPPQPQPQPGQPMPGQPGAPVPGMPGSAVPMPPQQLGQPGQSNSRSDYDLAG